MGMLTRKGFPLGWMPDADAVDAPAGALLRADNTVLDEYNILSLRRGTQKINDSPLPDSDVHSLHTQYLNLSRQRMVGAGDHVYANGNDLGVEMAGSGDVSFGTHMGQIFFARSTSKYKYNAVDVRIWGMEMGGGPPTVVPNPDTTTQFQREVATFDNNESPPWVWKTHSGPANLFAEGHDPVNTNTALVLMQDKSQRYGWVSRTFTSNIDFNAADANGNVPDDDTIVSVWVYIAVLPQLQDISIEFSTADSLNGDYFQTTWRGQNTPGADHGDRVTFVPGWNKLSRRRGDFMRVGSTFGKGWNTIRSMHANNYGFENTSAEVHFDNMTFTGSGKSSLDSQYQWVYQYVRDDGTYVTKTAASPASVSVPLHGQAVVVTVPADPTRDEQITEIWLYRIGGILDQYYRTKVQTGSFGTGPVDILDDISDQEALDLGITLEQFNEGPPDNIIDIEGPYYDRLFCLTVTHLYPSRRLSPEVYASSQVIRIAGADETCLWVKKAFNGLYIGTTKDIYRLDGTGAEFPDDTVEFTLTPLNIDSPPRNRAVAQDGNMLVYFSADGWRAFSGAGSQLLTGSTSKLYHGEDRHGVIAIFKDARIRADINRGTLNAWMIDNDNNQAMFQYVFSTQRWYRFLYRPRFLSIFSEPDGTLIAGDNAGYVREMHTGTDDDGDPTIAATIWTSRDDDGTPYSPKLAVGFSMNLDAGAFDYTAELYSNDDGVLLQRVVSPSFTMQPTTFDMTGVPAWRQLQVKITGEFRTLRFSGFLVPYLALPIAVKAWDSGPMDLGQQDLIWARRVQIKVRAGADLVVTPYFDDVLFPAVTIKVVPNKISIYEVPIGRAYFGRVPRLIIQSPIDFHPYWVEFMHRKTTSESEKPNTRIPSGMGGEANA